MDNTNQELLKELTALQKKYRALDKKHREDTSRLKKTEEELKLRLLFLEGIANSTIDGYLVVDPFGQKILQNQRTIQLWEIPQHIADDPSGRKQVEHVMKMTVNPEKFIAEIVYLREHPDEESRDEIELVNGTILDRYSSPVIGIDGKNYGRIWTFHDITDRKKTENQLFQLNADKDQFISILAHDLRNPLSNILGFSELLLNNLEAYPLKKLKTIIEAIFSSAQKTHLLLEDTLLWASHKSRNIVFRPTDIDATEIIAEVSDILLPGANMKNISIENRSRDRIMVYADIYMLKAILRNLLSNAVKFTREGGDIEISTKKDPDNIYFEVKDNGIGIPPEIKDKLFNVSTIQSTPGTANETGTGLGLILCKEFVDKHGGKIWIESNLKTGTSVSFTIPVIE